MRKLLLTCDWHLSENPRDAYRYGAVEQIRKLIREHKINDLFILGDLTDYAGGHSDLFVNRVVELLASLASETCVHIVRGNHDASDPAVPFFRFVNAIERCRYITETTGWEVEDKRILLIPNGAWPQPANTLGWDMIFTHETFSGAKAEHGKTLSGLRLPFEPVPIFSGDVHVPQRQGMVTYIGAPTAIRFGDTYHPRVLIMDLVAGSAPVVHTHPISGPTKKLYEVTVFANGDFTSQWATLNKGDIVKLRLTFNGDIPSLAHLRANLNGFVANRGATLYSIDVGSTQSQGPTPAKPVSRSDADLVRQYSNARAFPAPVVEAGLGIVKGERP